jgi:hypothetical protein
MVAQSRRAKRGPHNSIMWAAFGVSQLRGRFLARSQKL